MGKLARSLAGTLSRPLATMLDAGPAAGGGYSAQAQALFDRMAVQPNSTRKRLYDNLIRGLIQDGAWDYLDALYVRAAHTDQAALLNLVSSSFDCTAVNAPTFTTDRGFVGDGLTSYISTGFNVSTQGGLGSKYQRDSNHLFIWPLTSVDNAGANSQDFGVSNARISLVATTTTASGRRQDGATSNIVNSSYPGYLGWSRTGASVWRGYKDGVDVQGGTDASVALNNETFRELSSGSGGFGKNQIAVSHFGSGMPANIVLAARNRLRTYLLAVGAVV